jgi:hypothetical protein
VKEELADSFLLSTFCFQLFFPSLSPQSPMGGDSLGDAAGLECLAHEFEHGGVVENCR